MAACIGAEKKSLLFRIMPKYLSLNTVDTGMLLKRNTGQFIFICFLESTHQLLDLNRGSYR